MLQNRTCKECSVAFTGGPRAYFCQSCRSLRIRQNTAITSYRHRHGLTRKIGSTDTCERCKNTYTVMGSLQRFCLECKPIHTLEHDREATLTFYHINKEVINPVRNERRRKKEENEPS